MTNISEKNVQDGEAPRPAFIFSLPEPHFKQLIEYPVRRFEL